MLIVGSKALNKALFEFKREVNDIDVILTKSESECLIEMLQPSDIKYNHNCISLINIKKQEIFDTDNAELFICDDSPSLTAYMKHEKAYEVVKWAGIDTLFSIKKSHIHFPIKFNKHIYDYCLLYEKCGGIDHLYEITKMNFKETEERIGKLKTQKLNKSDKEFFGQSDGYVKSFFIHDDIHRIMSHYDAPLYERMKEDKGQKNKWEKFSFEDKCRCVLEEAYVIALERKIIPMLFNSDKLITSKEALDWSLMSICTTLCSGFFREFATNNYFKIYNIIDNKYVEKFLEAYRDGKIKIIGDK